MKSTQAMRDRIRELMGREQDDYDRAVECVLDDLEAVIEQPAQSESVTVDDLSGWIEHGLRYGVSSNDARTVARQLLDRFNIAPAQRETK